MKQVRNMGLGLVAVTVAFLMGCGERGGGHTYETTLVDTLDVYVHPVKRVPLVIVTAPPQGLRGLERFGGLHPRFVDLPLGNIHEERHPLVLFDSPEGDPAPLRIAIDMDWDLDLADEDTYRFHPHGESSSYFFSDTVTVSYDVDTWGVRTRVQRRAYFVLRWVEGDPTVRLEFLGHRVGTFDRPKGKSFPFILFDADNNGYYDERDILVIDTNQDGVIDGNRNSVERYGMNEPFLLGGRAYCVSGMNRAGTRFSIVVYKGEVTPRDRLEVGDPAPDFTLKDLSGQDVNLSRYFGKTILLVFWASW